MPLGRSEAYVTSAIVDFDFSEMHLTVKCELVKALSHHSDVLILDWGSFYQSVIGKGIQAKGVRCVSRSVSQV